MSQRFNFKNVDSIELPIDGTFYTDNFPPRFEKCAIVIALYDASGNIVTPSAGSCACEATPIEGQWHSTASSGDSVINLTSAGTSSTYVIPVFENAPITQARITLADVAGADHAVAYLWGF